MRIRGDSRERVVGMGVGGGEGRRRRGLREDIRVMNMLMSILSKFFQGTLLLLVFSTSILIVKLSAAVTSTLPCANLKQYRCGRHSDDWLFGGFSVTDAVKKIWQKGGKDSG